MDRYQTVFIGLDDALKLKSIKPKKDSFRWLNFRIVCCCGRGYSFDNPSIACVAYRQSTENLKSYMQSQWCLVGGMAGTFREME